MNQVKVLVEGYARELPGGIWEACSTVCLITTDKGLKIIVDPGTNRKLLLEKLAENSLKSEDIDSVFITHHHVDHVMNVALFAKAKVLDFEGVYDGDRILPFASPITGTDIEIISAPGHEYGNAVLKVPTKEGIIVIAADVFWWSEAEEQKVDLDRHDDFATDQAALKESRKMVLELADFVIPGHGKMFSAKGGPAVVRKVEK